MHDRFSALLKLAILALCINTAVSKCCLTKYGNDVMFPRNCESAKATLHINSESLIVEFIGDEKGKEATTVTLKVGGCEVTSDLLMSGDTQQLTFKKDDKQSVLALPVTETAAKESIEFYSKKSDPPTHAVQCTPYFKVGSNGNYLVDVEISLGKKSSVFYATFKSVSIHEPKVANNEAKVYIIASIAIGIFIFLAILGSIVGYIVYRRAQIEAEQKESERTSKKSKRTTRVRVINEEQPNPLKPEAFPESDEEYSEKSRLPRSSRC